MLWLIIFFLITKLAQENIYTSEHFYIYDSMKSVSKIRETSGIMPY